MSHIEMEETNRGALSCVSIDIPRASLVPIPFAPALGPNTSVEDKVAPTEADVEDKSLPLNWTPTRKWLIVLTISGMSFVVNLSTVICAPASTQISKEFNSNSDFLSIFYITVWDLGEAIAPLYIGPLSERVGRLHVYHFYNFFFIAFTVITGFSNNMAMIVVFRLLTGAATTCICLNPSIVGDMFSLETRGSAMSIMSLIPLIGTAVGPIVGGYVTQYLSWRWTFWLTAIFTGAVELALILVYRETYLPHIMRRRQRNSAEHSGSTTSSPTAQKKPLYLIPWRVLRFCMQPFGVLLRSRPATVISLYLSIVYAYLFLFAATLATVFQEIYSFSETYSGLIYIALAIGMLIGTLFCQFTLDRMFIKPPQTQTPSAAASTVRSEMRLLPAAPGMVILPIALFLYGWTIQFRVHWVVPTIAMALAGFCLSCTTIPVMSYLVDVYGNLSASAVAAVLPLRYLIGTFLPVAAPYMYKTLGYGWANSLLAFILIIILPAPAVMVMPPTKSHPKSVRVRLHKLVMGSGLN